MKPAPPAALPAMLVAALLALAACSDPSLHAGVRISPGGVSVQPVVSGTISDVTVTVAP